jgi:hypothetical protein
MDQRNFVRSAEFHLQPGREPPTLGAARAGSSRVCVSYCVLFAYRRTRVLKPTRPPAPSVGMTAIFWVAGLLLAMIDFPDFGTSLSRIAASTEQLAGIKPSDGMAGPQSESTTSDIEQIGGHAGAPVGKNEPRREGDRRVIVYSSDAPRAREKS